MYYILVGWDVVPERKGDFIAAALHDGSLSSATEPGTQRLELIADENNPNRFYLSEAYDDRAAFEAHLAGESLKIFLAAIKEFAVGPQWLARGTTVG